VSIRRDVATEQAGRKPLANAPLAGLAVPGRAGPGRAEPSRAEPSRAELGGSLRRVELLVVTPNPALACSRAPCRAADYQARVSGPLLDRIDLHVDVQAVSAADLTLPPPAERSRGVAARVARARTVQSNRYNGCGVRTNAEADGELLDRVARPDEPGRKLLADAAAAMRLSARAAFTGCFESHGQSPISPQPNRSAGSTSPRRSATEGRRHATSCTLETNA